MPDYSWEASMHQQGYQYVTGVDEAGRGPLAGPVVAAAVILPSVQAGWFADLDDSKKLSASRREYLFSYIEAGAMIGIGMADVAEIDQLNILAASMLAMERAVMALPVTADRCLIDGNRTPRGLHEIATPIVKGDSISISIAAASIIAKVTRDRIMAALHSAYPDYGWAKNQGYPTADHRKALALHGITPHHRRSFGPVRNILLKDAVS